MLNGGTLFLSASSKSASSWHRALKRTDDHAYRGPAGAFSPPPFRPIVAPINYSDKLLAAAGCAAISAEEFSQFRKLIFDIAGISLSEAKKSLLVGRLAKRLKHFGFASFSEYYRHVTAPQNDGEFQTMVDLLTTNETFFFREPKHFQFLQSLVTRASAPFRVWSAACSSGEEAYSMAMVLAEERGNEAWEVVGSDISSRVLAKAKHGHYPLSRTDGIPLALLRKYCLKGIGNHAGTLLIVKELRERVRFFQNNLMNPQRNLGLFDVIFLRNVMIYFNNETKRQVIANLLPFLKSDGYLVVGHSESLNGLVNELTAESPTIYRRVVRS